MVQELTLNELERYRAHIALPEIGIDGQRKLKKSSVFVVGAGGLGTAALYYLAAAGIGRIGIIDHDRVEINNLQRQILYTRSDIGEYKSKVACDKLHQFNEHSIVEWHSQTLTLKNALLLIEPYNLIIDASDNYATRYVINDVCYAAKKPFIYGAISHFEGQVAIFNYPTGSTNYRDLYPIPPMLNKRPSCAKGGVISALPGIIGSIQAIEAIKLLAGVEGLLSGKLWVINTLTWINRIYQLPRSTFVN